MFIPYTRGCIETKNKHGDDDDKFIPYTWGCIEVFPVVSFWSDGDFIGAYAGIALSDNDLQAIQKELRGG